MKKLWVIVGLAGLALGAASGSEREASHEPELVKAVDRYLATFAPNLAVPERDRLRASMVAPGYFYHGMDGRPIDFSGLTRRQTGNALTIAERTIKDRRIRRYGDTALVTFHAFERGADKGRDFSGTGSWVTVLTRTAKGWHVAADIVGQDPPPPR